MGTCLSEVSIRDSGSNGCDSPRMTISTVMPEVERDEAIERLEREVAELRREVAALRDGLATEVRTARIVVADGGGRDVTIEPGNLVVHAEANGCYVLIGACHDRAELYVTACDDPVRFPGQDVQHVNLVAWVERDVEPGGPHAEIWTTAGEVPVFDEGRLLLSR